MLLSALWGVRILHLVSSDEAYTHSGNFWNTISLLNVCFVIVRYAKNENYSKLISYSKSDLVRKITEC